MNSNSPQIQRLYRSRKSKVIGGVAGGLGEYFNVDPLWIRLLFIISVLFGGFGLLMYVILWVIIPLAPANEHQHLEVKHLYRSRKERMLAGVCGGLSEYFNIDPTWVRLLFVLLLLFGLGFGLLLYFILWIIVPLSPEKI